MREWKNIESCPLNTNVLLYLEETKGYPYSGTHVSSGHTSGAGFWYNTDARHLNSQIACVTPLFWTELDVPAVPKPDPKLLGDSNTYTPEIIQGVMDFFNRTMSVPQDTRSAELLDYLREIKIIKE